MLELIAENGMEITSIPKKDIFLDMCIQQGLPEFTAFFIRMGVVPKLNIKSSDNNLIQAFKLENKRQLEVISVLLSYMVKNKYSIKLPTCMFLHGDKFFILKLYQQLQDQEIKTILDLKLLIIAGLQNHSFSHSETFYKRQNNKKFIKLINALQKSECDTITKIKSFITDSRINNLLAATQDGLFKCLLRFIDDYSVINRPIEKNKLIENNDADEIQIKKQRRM